MIEIFSINFNLRIVIRLIELLLLRPPGYLCFLRLLSSRIEYVIRAASIRVELVVNLLFLLDFLLSPLDDLLDILVFNFHLPLLVLFV
jgi:hypothetical protein